jgi:Flp pilus assembly secretin CpaC
LYQGIHDLTTDVIKIALYTANANLNEDTTMYSSTDEVAATGTYSLGGAQLTPITVNTSGYTAYVGFPNISWTGAITARCALIYNETQGNKSVAVLDFGSDKTSVGTFTITMPANTATAALIRSSN